MNIREEIAQQALSLAPEDRVYLVQVLEQSLTPDGFGTPEIQAAWAAEIDRRIEAYDRGEVAAADFETALSSMRQHLTAHRERKSTS